VSDKTEEDESTARKLLDYYARCYKDSIGLQSKKLTPLLGDSEVRLLAVLSERYFKEQPISLSISEPSRLIDLYKSGYSQLANGWLKSYQANKKDYDLVFVANFYIRSHDDSSGNQDVLYRPEYVYSLNDIGNNVSTPDTQYSARYSKIGEFDMSDQQKANNCFQLKPVRIQSREKYHQYFIDVDRHKHELVESFELEFLKKIESRKRGLKLSGLALPEHVYPSSTNNESVSCTDRFQTHLARIDAYTKAMELFLIRMEEHGKELAEPGEKPGPKYGRGRRRKNIAIQLTVLARHLKRLENIKYRQEKEFDTLEYVVSDVAMILLVPKAWGERLDYGNLLSVIDRTDGRYQRSNSYFSLISKCSDWCGRYNRREKISHKLTPSQNGILSKCISNEINVIQGAPGTGKTHLVCELVRHLSSDVRRVLVTSRNSHALKVIEKKLLNNSGIDPSVIFTAYDQESSKKRISDFDYSGGINNSVGELSDVVDVNEDISRNGSDLEKELNRGALKTLDTRNSIINKLRRALVVTSSKRKKTINKLLKNYGDYSNKSEKIYQDEVNRKLLSSQRKFFDEYGESWNEFVELIQSMSIYDAGKAYNSVGYGFHLSGAFSIVIAPFKMLPHLSHRDFDTTIIDEAGQCNIAESLPALLQAEQLYVIGDANQLNEVSFISKRQEAHHAERLGLSEDIAVKFRDNSILDFVTHYLSESRPDCVHTLTEQFRSPPSIIRFNIENYYQREHQYYTGLNTRYDDQSLSWVYVEGLRVNGRNEVEAKATLALVRKLIDSQAMLPSSNKQSIGVISFFRGQAEYLQKKILAELSLDEIIDHNIKIGTPFSFQGDEKDHIYISCAIDKNSHAATWNYLNNPNVFNVTTSRAKVTQTVVYSISTESMPKGSLIREYYKYYSESLAIEDPLFSTPTWHRELLQCFVDAGFQYSSCVSIGNCTLNTVMHYKGNSVAIDFIGFSPQMSDHLSVDTYRLFHAMNIPLVPIMSTDWLHRREGVIQDVIEWSEISDATSLYLEPNVGHSLFETTGWKKWLSFKSHHSVDEELHRIIESIDTAIRRLLERSVDDKIKQEIVRTVINVIASLNKNADTFILLYSQLFDENSQPVDSDYWLRLRRPIFERFCAYQDQLVQLSIPSASVG